MRFAAPAVLYSARTVTSSVLRNSSHCAIACGCEITSCKSSIAEPGSARRAWSTRTIVSPTRWRPGRRKRSYVSLRLAAWEVAGGAGGAHPGSPVVAAPPPGRPGGVVAELRPVIAPDHPRLDRVHEVPVVARLLPVVAEDTHAGELFDGDLRLSRPVRAHQARV